MNAFRSCRDKAAVAYDILPPEAIGSGRVRAPAPKQVVEDAHFVTLAGDARQVSPTRFHNDNRKRTPSPTVHVVNAGPASFIERMIERIEGLLMRMSADFFSALVAFVFVLVFGLSGGFALLSGGSGSAARAASLDITHVTVTPQDASGMSVLLISGIVENRTSGRMAMPPLRAQFLVDGRAVTTTIIEPTVGHLDKDHSHGFSARVPHPGGKNPQLRLSFAETDATPS